MQSLGKLLVYSANRIPRFECHQVGNCMFSTSHALLAREKFERTRENVNIVTLGGHQHGKTWLASELSRVLAAQEDGVTHKTVEMIDHSSSERENRNGQIFFTNPLVYLLPTLWKAKNCNCCKQSPNLSPILPIKGLILPKFY